MANEIVKKLGMKSDIVFKAFFSREENKKFLEEFISAVLGEKIKIKNVVHDARLELLAKEDKYGVLDLDVELEDGKKVNIEIQLQNNHNMEERTTYYSSKKITEQIGIGQEFEEINQVIIIAILDYCFIDLPEYITRTVRVANEHREYEINNVEKYIYIELEKFRKQNPDMKNKLNQWIAFIDRERGDLLEMAKKENKEIKEAEERYNVLTGDAELKRLAEVRLLSQLEGASVKKVAREEGREEGRKEGRKEGQMAERLEIAKKMKSKNIPIEEIIELTCLTKEQIENLTEN